MGLGGQMSTRPHNAGARFKEPPVHEPFFREAGAGPGVVCLHSNASSSNQWRTLLDELAPQFHVLAPDGHGAGKGPPWPRDRMLRLSDEAAALEPVFARAGDPFCLVGHSYGAAVALVAALEQRPRVRALALYEPTLFAVVEAADEIAGIHAAVAQSVAALARGDGDDAARAFIDFWMGDGAWARTPDARKAPIVASCANVQGWADALLREPTPLAAFAALDMPVLLMVGERSPRASLAVAQRFAATLPNATVQRFPGLGHMGPVTDPAPVNAAIRAFLQSL